MFIFSLSAKLPVEKQMKKTGTIVKMVNKVIPKVVFESFVCGGNVKDKAD